MELKPDSSGGSILFSGSSFHSSQKFCSLRNSLLLLVCRQYYHTFGFHLYIYSLWKKEYFLKQSAKPALLCSWHKLPEYEYKQWHIHWGMCTCALTFSNIIWLTLRHWEKSSDQLALLKMNWTVKQKLINEN